MWFLCECPPKQGTLLKPLMLTLELPLQHPSLRVVFGAKGILPWGEGVSSSLAEAMARWCGSICGPFSDTLPTQLPPCQGQSRRQSHWAVGRGKAEAGTWTYREEPPQTWSFLKAPFPQTWVSLPFSLHIPSTHASPWSPQSSVFLLLVTVETPASPTRGGAISPPDPSHARQTQHSASSKMPSH